MQATRMIMKSSSICECFAPNSVYTQCIRWKRKPLWLPPGKTKMFRVPVRPVVNEEERVELQRLYNGYRTFMNSLRSHIIRTVKTDQVKVDEEHLKQAEEEDFKVCSAINDEWNASIRKVRDARLEVEREARKERILREMMRKEEQERILQAKADEEIRKVKQEAVHFITPDKVDEAIEECLANIVDHNRAMDLDGNWYDGKHPPTPTNEQPVTQPKTMEQ